MEDLGHEAGSLLIFTATFNERENVSALIANIWNVLPRAQVLIVDDNSPDGTGELLESIAASDSRLTVLRRPSKLGLGTAHHLAMLYAMRGGFGTLVTMDADQSHDPNDIPKLVKKLDDADFVIGSRYMPGGQSDYGGYRRLVSVGANTAARVLLGIRLHEFTTSFRAFRVERLKRVNFVKMHNFGYSFFMESVYRLHQAGLTLAEVPIYFRDRKAGVSKIPRLEIVRGIAKLLHLTLSRLLRRPMQAPSPPIEEACANCGSKYLSELFPAQLEAKNEVHRSNAFRCSSMGHASKPRVAKCLVCALCQVPRSQQPPDLRELYADVVDETYVENLPAKRKTFANAFRRRP